MKSHHGCDFIKRALSASGSLRRSTINVAFKHPNLRRAVVILAKAGIQEIRRVIDYVIHRRMTNLIAE